MNDIDFQKEIRRWQSMKRYAAQHNAKPLLSFAEWLRIIWKAGGRCYYCRKNIRQASFVLEHVYPLKLGGAHSYKNVVLACRQCNTIKQGYTPDKWLLEASRSYSIRGYLCSRIASIIRHKRWQVNAEVQDIQIAKPCRSGSRKYAIKTGGSTLFSGLNLHQVNTFYKWIALYCQSVECPIYICDPSGNIVDSFDVKDKPKIKIVTHADRTRATATRLKVQ